MQPRLIVATNTKPNSVVDYKLKPTAELHILIGGPYTINGKEHRYGHTALRIKTTKSDITYDFGRYGETTGVLGESGEGILRVWSDFSAYIKSENKLNRITTDFIYLIFDAQADATTAHFSKSIKAGTPRLDLETGRGTMKVYKLTRQYDALTNNCTTISMEGAKQAIPKIDVGSTKFIKPEAAMNLQERIAMKSVGGGTPDILFLPANLQEFLQISPSVNPNSIVAYGGKK